MKIHYPKKKKYILNIGFSYNQKTGEPELDIAWNSGKRDRSGIINASMLFMLGSLADDKKNPLHEEQWKILKCLAKTLVEHDKYLNLPNNL